MRPLSAKSVPSAGFTSGSPRIWAGPIDVQLLVLSVSAGRQRDSSTSSTGRKYNRHLLVGDRRKGNMFFLSTGKPVIPDEPLPGSWSVGNWRRLPKKVGLVRESEGPAY